MMFEDFPTFRMSKSKNLKDFKIGSVRQPRGMCVTPLPPWGMGLTPRLVNQFWVVIDV